jgi:hypothetical protein
MDRTFIRPYRSSSNSEKPGKVDLGGGKEWEEICKEYSLEKHVEWLFRNREDADSFLAMVTASGQKEIFEERLFLYGERRKTAIRASKRLAEEQQEDL